MSLREDAERLAEGLGALEGSVSTGLGVVSDKLAELETRLGQNDDTFVQIHDILSRVIQRIQALEGSTGFPEPEPEPEPEPVPEPEPPPPVIEPTPGAVVIVCGPGQTYQNPKAALERADELSGPVVVEVLPGPVYGDVTWPRRNFENIELRGKEGRPEIKQIYFGGSNVAIGEAVVAGIRTHQITALRGGSLLALANVIVDGSHHVTGGAVVVQGHDNRWESVELFDVRIYDRNASSRTQGIYADRIDRLSLLECTIDRCGYPDVLSHGAYLQSSVDFVGMSDCWISRSGSHGAQVRGGGDVVDSTFWSNPIQLLVGSSNDEPRPGGVIAGVGGCDLLHARDISPDLPRGWGLELENLDESLHAVTDNIIADERSEGDLVHAFSNDRPDARIEFRDNYVRNHGGTGGLVSLPEPPRPIRTFAEMRAEINRRRTEDKVPAY